MKNLSEDNIYRDEGEISFDIINNVESRYGVKLPHMYREFIMKHNGARLDIDSFDFYDQVRGMPSSEGLAFMKVENIQEMIDDLLD